VQISYLRSVAVTKECGDWSTDLANTSSNQPFPNYGCAIQNNIAAMVVNPEDFVVPRPTTPVLAAARLPVVSATNAIMPPVAASTTSSP
jgi:pilus assembly protein CpaD